MTTLFDQAGNKVRAGKAGIARVLKEPVNVTADYVFDYAMVHDDDTDTYITRDGEKARACTFTVIWFEGRCQKSKKYEFAERDQAIENFLRKCGHASKRERLPIHEDSDSSGTLVGTSDSAEPSRIGEGSNVCVRGASGNTECC